MRGFVLSATVILLILPGAMLAAQTTTPEAESMKLAVFVGSWTSEGNVFATPLGPAGKTTGSTSLEMLGTSFLVGTYQEKGPSGESKGVEVYGYDTAKKTGTWVGFDKSGVSTTGTWSVSGSNWIMTGTMQLPGKTVQQKCSIVVAVDGMSVSGRCEVSTDGKSWLPSGEVKYSKVR